MYTITVEDKFGQVLHTFQYNQEAEAIRVARGSAKTEQGRAVVSDGEDMLVCEFKYENGRVNKYDDAGNRLNF